MHKNSGASGAVISVPPDSDFISSKLKVGDPFEVGELRCGAIEDKLKSLKSKKDHVNQLKDMVLLTSVLLQENVDNNPAKVDNK